MEGKVIIVTGETGILGNSFINGIVVAGRAVGIFGRNEKVANERTDAINIKGGKAVTLIADAMDSNQSINALEKLIKDLGEIDGIVNLAGGIQSQGILQFSDGNFQMNMQGMKEVVDLNLRGTLSATQVFGKAISQKTHKGRIVNISSMN